MAWPVGAVTAYGHHLAAAAWRCRPAGRPEPSIRDRRDRLTARFRCFQTPKRWRVSNFSLKQSCRSTIGLHLFYRNPKLIRKGQRVNSCQSRVHETEKWSFVLRKFLSVETNPNSDLWDHFEHVVHIFMTWSQNTFCSSYNLLQLCFRSLRHANIRSGTF